CRHYAAPPRSGAGTGAGPGDGLPTISEVQVVPQPSVIFPEGEKQMKVMLGGREETADCLVKEISLTYAETELLPFSGIGPNGLNQAPPNQQFLWRITE